MKEFLSKIKYFQEILVVLLLIIYAIVFYHGRMNEFPNHIHAWTQSDRYALAIGYERNGLDVFHPETNCTIPNKNENNYKLAGRMAVDLPIPEIVVASLMKITGSKEPWVFRYLTLIFALIGFFYFFRTIKLLNNHFLIPIIALIVLISSPVITYYTNGFIPSVYSFSCFLIALFFYVKYFIKDKKDFRPFYISIFWMTIAVLTRSPYILILMTLSGALFLRQLLDKKFRIKEVFPVIISLMCIFGYALYNKHYNDLYGSLFIRDIQNADSFAQFKECIIRAYWSWHFDYFTVYHYYLFLVMIFVSIMLGFIYFNKEDKLQWTFIFTFITHFFISISYAILMIKQAPDHDYYWYDTLFPVFIFFFCLVFYLLINFKLRYLKLTSILIGCLLPLMLVADFNTQKRRNTTHPNDRQTQVLYSYIGSNILTKQIGIHDTDKINVIDALTFNIPLLLMNKKGHCLLSTRKDYLEYIVNTPEPYLCIQNQYFYSDVISVYPEFGNHVKFFGGNSKITFFTHDTTNRPKSIEELLGCSTKHLVYGEQISANKPKSVYWNAVKTNVLGSDTCLYLSPEDDYGLGFKYPVANIKSKSIMVIIKWKILVPENPSIATVVASQLKTEKDDVYYDHRLEAQFSIAKQRKTWQEQVYVFSYDPHHTPDNAINTFISNYGKEHLYLKDVSIQIYE